MDLGDGSAIGYEPPSPDGSVPVGVWGSALRLLEKSAQNSIGSFKLPDLDPGSVVKGFDLRCNVTMDAQTAAALAEGWSISFGPLPPDHGTGEGGFVPLPNGLVLSFDTRDSIEDPAGIEIWVGGVSLARFPRTFPLSPAPRFLAVHWDSAGLDVSFDGKSICTDLATPGFAPGVGNTFAFSARSLDGSYDLLIDNLKVTTQPLPALNTGGPIISEFVANNSLVEDEFADKPDWIELFNGSGQPASLEGWYLTDSKKSLTKWRITGLTINPYNYQLIYASGRNIQGSATHGFHTNFKLGKDGGYLALVRPDGKTIASAYEYGPQDLNVSMGETGAERKRGYLFPASPGLVNTAEPAAASLCPLPDFSHPGGIVTNNLDLTLTIPGLPGAEVRYTLDRTEPSTNSPIYSNSIPITRFTTVKARTFAPGHLPSPVTSRSFLFVDDSLLNFVGTGKPFDSNLPLIFLDSFAVSIDGSTGGARPFRPSYAVVISPDPLTGRAALTTSPDYAGPSGVHTRGESSAGFDQRSYAFEIWDDAGMDAPAGLCGMPADSDWILYGPWSEKTLMRNKLVFDWMRALRGSDGSAVRSRFVELFFNQSRPASGRIGYSTYRGIYVLMEKLKRGHDRVPLENLNEKTVDPELITGGYIFRKDKDDALKSNWASRNGIPLQSFDPDHLNPAQLNYLKGYINTFETVLGQGNSRDPISGYRAYLDPDTFIDAQWMLEISKQVDGYVFSTYFHKDRGGRVRAGPLWDFNIALGNADYATGDTPTGWLYDVAGGVGQLWYPRLHADPNYKLAHWDRYWQMRRSLLTPEAVSATIDRHMATLLDGFTGAVSNRMTTEVQNPVARHFRRWPRLGTRDWPNPPAETKIRTYQAEVDYMRAWLLQRLEWLDDQSMRAGTTAYRPPVFSHPGGDVPGPLQLTMAPYRRDGVPVIFPNGSIYYTTDDSDPRLPNGNISPTARLYQSPLDIRTAQTVNARLYVSRQWSPLMTASFFLGTEAASSNNLAISEILYQPAALSADELSAKLSDPARFAYIELRNVGSRPVDLRDVVFTRGITFDFAQATEPARLLPPSGSVLLVADRRSFSIRFPGAPVSQIAGEFQGHLSSDGETLRVETRGGRLIEELRYETAPPWPSLANGDGKSLVLLHPSQHPDPANPRNWAASIQPGGTPGTFGLGQSVFSGEPAWDTDADGISDYFEFVAGSDPEDPNSRAGLHEGIEVLEVAGTKGAYFTLRFRHQAGLTADRVLLETSADAVNWHPAEPAWILMASDANSDGTVTDTYRTPAPVTEDALPMRLLRLRVAVQ